MKATHNLLALATAVMAAVVIGATEVAAQRYPNKAIAIIAPAALQSQLKAEVAK